MTTINFLGEDYRLVRSTYQNNNALYVGLANDEDEYCGDITVNLPISGTLPSDCAFIDTNNMPRLPGILMASGIVEPIDQSCRSGFCMYMAYRFKNLSEIDDITSSIN